MINKDPEYLKGTLKNQKFVFAKTMPDNPHYYTLRKSWGSDEEFNEVVKLIRSEGTEELFFGKPFTYLILDGYRYWTMGAPVEKTTLINRKREPLGSNYDLIAEVYDDLFADDEDKEIEKRLFQELVIGHDESVLDIGCGTGLLLDYAKPSRYVGIDPSAGMTSKLFDKHEHDPTITIHNLYFEEFLTREKFDRVVSLLGSFSYITPENLIKAKALLKQAGGGFAMIYKDTYSPVTYERAHVQFAHYTAKDYAQVIKSINGTVTEFDQYIVVRF
jgi:hypothetical protein